MELRAIGIGYNLIAGKLRGLQPLGKGSPLVVRVKSNSITQTEISVSCMKNATLPAYKVQFVSATNELPFVWELFLVTRC
jgi:hypothetical protein